MTGVANAVPWGMLSADLKARTRPHHDAAEASPAMQAVMSDNLTRDVYRDHLARLLAFYAPTEAALADVAGLADVLPDLDARLVKAGWLREDLAALGHEATAPAGQASSLDVGRALGALYVIEGSTLGGRLIARHLERTLGVSADAGARFYLSYGDERGDRWTALKQALDRFGADHPGQTDLVVASAAGTFDALRAQMDASLAA